METVSFTLSLATFVYDTISDIKDGPSHVRSTAEKVVHFRNQLERIRELSDPKDMSHAGLLNDVRESVNDLNTFASKLRKLQTTPDERATGKMWKRWRMVLNEKDFDTISTQISQRSAQIAMHLDVLNRRALFRPGTR